MPVTHRRRAFTLVELLVVISVISVLVSLLLPAIGKSRMRAKFLACQTNLHSLGVGMLVYANDNASAYPYRKCTMLGGSQATLLSEYSGFSATAFDDRPLFNTYLNIDQAFVCPLSPLPAGESFKAGTNLQIWGSYEVWGGSNFAMADPKTKMARVGDRPELTVGGTRRQFNILANDFERDWDGQNGAYYLNTSHADDINSLVFATIFDQTTYSLAHYFHWFNSAAAMNRGMIERNFLTDDGAVRARRLAFRDPATVRVPFASSTILPAVYAWLPPME